MGASTSSEEASNFTVPPKKIKEVRFYLHDKEHVAKSNDITPNTSLNFYLRNTLNMTGTKGMCYEGGCGSCVVVLQNVDPITKKDIFVAVNSCLIPLLSCNGWKIITIEGIGNPKEGYHPLQEVLAQFNGTQCGFCSPGMVMTMYALYESGKFTMEQVENAFSGNLCRCTGYRPILSAFKSLASDASAHILGECPDMEDFVKCYKEKCAKKCTKVCTTITKKPVFFEFEESKWVKVHTLRDLLATLTINLHKSYRLVAGNTAQGVYSSYKEDVYLYVDIADVAELVEFTVKGDFCKLGANTTLTDTIEIFTELAKKPKFSYLQDLANHINLIANVPVRNRGTLAGNLMIKHDHHDFPSDIFLILETVAATLTVVNIFGVETHLTPHDFINFNMTKPGAVLKTITLPAYSKNEKYVSYKIMPRAQNTHAIVNAGFLLKFDSKNNIKDATIVYGNINPDFIHATASEKLLAGKSLFDNSVLKKIYNSLDRELNPNLAPPDPSPELRKQLAIALFYKAVLSIAPDTTVSERNKSGGQRLQRPVSSGTQDFGTNKSLYPLTEPITKLEALAQTSGVAQYVIDLPDLPFQLHGALVLAKAPPNSTVTHIDPSKALNLAGVVAFYSKNDIPGDNIFTALMLEINAEEELFVNGTVKFFDQPVGVVIAESRSIATHAADLIDITYNLPASDPLLTIREVLKTGDTKRITEFKKVTATRKGKNIKHVIKGSLDLYQQYHFHMETHCCQVVPTEDGLEVYAATQWMDLIQAAIARVLKIPQNKIHVVVRRCGGGFGGKISRCSLVACAAALGAWKLKKPVRIWLPLTTNMLAIGKRSPLSTDYEVAVDDKGIIQYLNCSLYTDAGYEYDEDMSRLMEPGIMGTYINDTFTVHFVRVLTDTHVNTWIRGPGHVEGLTTIESIMDHIAYTLNLDALQVRKINLSDQSPLNKYIDDMKSWAKIDQRKSDIAVFNTKNRWRKKGLSVVNMSFELPPIGAYMTTVSIFHTDGSVQITHAGVEIGQGINTKAAQVCAYKLKIPLDKVRVLPSNTFVSPNTATTGGSVTSEAVCHCIIKACDKLLERIKPFRPHGTTWEDAVKKAYENNTKLNATGTYSKDDPDIKTYSTYGVCTIEVEVDILTGQHLLSKVDLIEDVGVTLSPYVDIGQVEGAFIMGLGYQTTEKIVYNKKGEILTNNTWTYHVPGAKDIPVEFNVKFPKDNPNPIGVLHSKATGEPSLCFAVGIALAIRNALASARIDASSSNTKWYPIDGVTDVENVFLNSSNDYSQYVL